MFGGRHGIQYCSDLCDGYYQESKQNTVIKNNSRAHLEVTLGLNIKSCANQSEASQQKQQHMQDPEANRSVDRVPDLPRQSSGIVPTVQIAVVYCILVGTD